MAAGFAEFVDPHPVDGNQFGAAVVPLSTGNVVITSPYDDAGGTDAGAVYLFNGRTGQLISTLTGSHANDHVGIGGVTALTNGNFVIASPDWDSDTTQDVGAATWGDGKTGITGVVSADDSLVGSTAQDRIASSSSQLPDQGTVIPLKNGNYVIYSSSWDNGAIVDAGAVTWGNGATGTHGEVTPENSLVGSTAGDQVGLYGVTALTNGNYVVRSLSWDNGAVVDAGAATFGDGSVGISGPITPANSLVGTMKGDKVGFAYALPNGNYVAISFNWHTSTGAATFGNGTAGVTGPISADNSLVGSTPGDSPRYVKILANGNYVVDWDHWDNGNLKDAGAVTFGSGTTGVSGVVSADNSLVGGTAFDGIGSRNIIALSNGNYVVSSPNWTNGSLIHVGAATFGDGNVGIHGVITTANSLVGSQPNDQLGSGNVTALANGNYVVASPFWDNGSTADVGAVTLGNGLTGTVGQVDASKSLIGVTAGDKVGGGVTSGSVFALTNGNYVVCSPLWDNGALADVGAVTFGNGTTGISGPVSVSNSLVGSTAGDQVGLGYEGFAVAALTNGNYVVISPNWNNGDATAAGALTFGNGQSGIVGVVSPANSLVGSTANDQLGGGVLGTFIGTLSNGNYVIGSPLWDNGGIADAGAATFGNGTTGLSGVLGPSNSLVGSSTGDQLSADLGAHGIQPLASGNYLIVSHYWDNGTLTDAGAVTFGDATTGIQGTIDATNSVMGGSANAGLANIIQDNINQTFFAPFATDGSGHVRVGSQLDGFSHAWHLATMPEDVNNDGFVAPGDALAIINYINARQPTDVGPGASVGGPWGFLDVTGDNKVVPADALYVINYINSHGPGAEGEAGTSPDASFLAVGGAEVGLNGAAVPDQTQPLQSAASSGADDTDALLMLLAMDAEDAVRRKH